LIARGRTQDFDHRAAYDLRLFGVYAYDAIATCHLRLGNYGESRRYYELAQQEEPNQLEYRVKRELCSTLQRRARALARNC
jgi:hypothetical protein